MAEWKATAFTSDVEHDYSVSFQGDKVVIERDPSGLITVEITDEHRRAFFVLPERLFLTKQMRTVSSKPKPKTDDEDWLG